MLAAVAWVAQVSLARWAWPVCVFPPLGMFALGAGLMLWATLGQDPRKGLLDKAIADGRAILAVKDHHVLWSNWNQWNHDVLHVLRERFGVAAGLELGDAGRAALDASGQDVRAWLAAEVEYLEELRARGRRTPGERSRE
jgi:hypothetical protein